LGKRIADVKRRGQFLRFDLDDGCAWW